jgi:DNA-directed RNA polymerase specialized sigma24 family protein
LSTNNIGEIGYNRNRKAIETAYQNLLDNKEGAEAAFLKAVTSLAKSKISGRIFDLPEGCSNADDYSQDVAIMVWKRLPTHTGGVERIYRHVHKIIYTTREHAYHQIKDEARVKVPLLVEKEGEEGDSYFEDNPLLHPRDYPTHRRKLPEFIHGVDLEICQYIREGHNYGRIAEILSMTEKAIELRIARIRNKIEEMKNAKS